jgi:hypothetical protein
MTPDELRNLQIEAIRKLIVVTNSGSTIRRALGFRDAESLLNPELLLKDRGTMSENDCQGEGSEFVERATTAEISAEKTDE